MTSGSNIFSRTFQNLKLLSPVLCRNLNFYLQDFPEPIDFPGLPRSWDIKEKKSRTFQEAWEP